ncbi:hypothetical protein EKK58_07170 [Candidatus Dependentiae bacterium]|nr:MAG: hypothetical protein EKK58_07170 [Candidatus Dependentiae bacterium]
MNGHQEVVTFVANVLPIASVVSFAVDKYCTSPLVFNFNIDANNERKNYYNKDNKDKRNKSSYENFISEIQQRSKVLCESKIQTLLNIVILLGTCYTLYEMRKSFFQHDDHLINLMYQGGCCLSLIWQIHNWSNAFMYQENCKSNQKQLMQKQFNDLQNQVSKLGDKLNLMHPRIEQLNPRIEQLNPRIEQLNRRIEQVIEQINDQVNQENNDQVNQENNDQVNEEYNDNDDV